MRAKKREAAGATEPEAKEQKFLALDKRVLELEAAEREVARLRDIIRRMLISDGEAMREAMLALGSTSDPNVKP